MPVTEYTWNPLTDSVIEETDGAGGVSVEYTNEPAPYGPLLSVVGWVSAAEPGCGSESLV